MRLAFCCGQCDLKGFTMMEEYEDLPDEIIPPAMRVSGNKKATNYALLIRDLTNEDWKEICWLEEHVATIS
jgi:hypothetical protein